MSQLYSWTAIWHSHEGVTPRGKRQNHSQDGESPRHRNDKSRRITLGRKILRRDVQAAIDRPRFLARKEEDGALPEVQEEVAGHITMT